MNENSLWESCRIFLITSLVVFFGFMNGCVSIPLFRNTLKPVSRKEAIDLVKSTWISFDKGQRLLLSFVQKGDGNYVVVFQKSKIIDGKLEQKNYLIPGVITKAGNKRFLFLKADSDGELIVLNNKGKLRNKSVAAVESDESDASEESFMYLLLNFEIKDDLLSLSIVEGDVIAELIDKGSLKGTITKERWTSTVKVNSNSDDLEKVLSTINLFELADKDKDKDYIKVFKRKS